jgi:hypothetical protein
VSDPARPGPDSASVGARAPRHGDAMERLRSTVAALIGAGEAAHRIFDPTEQLQARRPSGAGMEAALNAAFLVALAGERHPDFQAAAELLAGAEGSREWAGVARFYRLGLEVIPREIESACREDPRFAERVESAAARLSGGSALEGAALAEVTWSVFFPEGAGLREHARDVQALRARRSVAVTQLNPEPLSDPIRQILFTSNALLGLPPASRTLEEIPLAGELKEELRQVLDEPQLYWFDHPIQIGVEPEGNELLYGLRGLEAAVEFERARGRVPTGGRLRCALSVSTTHRGLQAVAKRYLEGELARSGGLRNLDVWLFTETDARLIADEVLAPAAGRYLGRDDAEEQMAMFGVDGEYGRHYSFLKAIAALWSVFVEPEVAATFKIDLDQVFPQRELLEQSGSSALEHFTTPLWGAHGLDSAGRSLELGMIAGALVNERDIGRSLFTPDVPPPDQPLQPDEYVFFSRLPQAVSTEAEMMTRYTSEEMDGRSRCLQRIHVTGGTNGILVDSLRRHRPFTPSFVGRAEDQAYILSVLYAPGPRLAYAHKDGLIMRHDKEAFAQTAIEAARMGQLVGDYVRLIYFSAYARLLSPDVGATKAIIDPFTGSFVSRIPATVAYLRFALKAGSLFAAGQQERGMEFVALGARRIPRALEFVSGEDSPMRAAYERERRGWDLYFDTLTAVEAALERGDEFALHLRTRATGLVESCRVRLA